MNYPQGRETETVCGNGAAVLATAWTTLRVAHIPTTRSLSVVVRRQIRVLASTRASIISSVMIWGRWPPQSRVRSNRSTAARDFDDADWSAALGPLRTGAPVRLLWSWRLSIPLLDVG